MEGKKEGKDEERRKVDCKKEEKIGVGDGEDGAVKCIGNGKE